MLAQVNGTQACICIGHFKYQYGGSFTSYIMIMNLFIEMGPPMLESQVKESQSNAAPPILAQEGVGA